LKLVWNRISILLINRQKKREGHPYCSGVSVAVMAADEVDVTSNNWFGVTTTGFPLASFVTSARIAPFARVMQKLEISSGIKAF
jgi:hypothetical protein